MQKLLSYLEECCREIEEISYKINHTYNSKNGYMTEQIFYWKNDFSRIQMEYTKSLRKFMIQEFNWKWVTKANIVLSSDQNSLEISDHTNYALITLNNQRDGATLSLNGKKIFEFIVRPAIDMLILEAPTKQRLDTYYMLLFQLSQQIRAQGLIFSILSAYGSKFAASRVADTRTR